MKDYKLTIEDGVITWVENTDGSGNPTNRRHSHSACHYRYRNAFISSGVSLDSPDVVYENRIIKIVFGNKF